METRRIKLLRKRSLVGFTISAIICLIAIGSNVSVRDDPIYHPIPVRKPTPVPLPNSTQLISEGTAYYFDTPAFGAERPEPPSNKLLYLVTVVSGLSSATALLGFMSTTVLAWRKDKREAEQARIDNETKLFDLEIKRKNHKPVPNNQPRKKDMKNVKRVGKEKPVR